MERLFIPAKASVSLVPLFEKVNVQGYGIVTTVQHLEKFEGLDLKGNTFLGQVLGCNVKVAKGFSGYIFVGSGKFHAIQIARETGKKVILANPFTLEIKELTDEVEKIEKRVKGAYLKFLNAKKVGILVSVKPGQNYMQGKPNLKNSYTFVCDNVAGLENFTDIDVFVNTACPRLAYEGEFEKCVINWVDLEKLMSA
tara:strand:- start:516 stop:1106 length:591 start_codon:yes stop_codon:yes gene_type:complete